MSSVTSVSNSTQYYPPTPTSGDKDIRKSYNKAITNTYENEFKGKFAAIHEKDQCFGDQLAREAFKARSTIKEAHQGKTSIIGNIAAGLHNLVNYGSWSNPDYDYFLKQGKTPEEIAYSAFKTGGGDLGLENNGFGEVLQVWSTVKDQDIGLYPENITTSSLACFKEATDGKLDKSGVKAAVGACLPASNPFKLA